MRATLTFNLVDPDDCMAHMRCVKSLDMALAMWEFSVKLRSIVNTSEDGKWIDEDLVWKAWSETLEDHNINLDKLIN